MDDRTLKRSGLDYWDQVDLFRHTTIEDLFNSLTDSRFVYLTTKAAGSYTAWEFRYGDCLVFGPETRGLPAELLSQNAASSFKIPMVNPNVRSLNLATSVGIVLSEAIRQLNSAA